GLGLGGLVSAWRAQREEEERGGLCEQGQEHGPGWGARSGAAPRRCRRRKRRCLYLDPEREDGRGEGGLGDHTEDNSTAAPVPGGEEYVIRAGARAGAGAGLVRGVLREAAVGAESGTKGGSPGNSGDRRRALGVGGDREGLLPVTFEDQVDAAVSRLQELYRGVVEGGQASPVEYVLTVMPEAVRELTDSACDPANNANPGGATPPMAPTPVSREGKEEQRARATARILQAVSIGLSCSPSAITAKHKARR
ncbi:unnamed protein product, partial [Discosporangium mesarthrocarpum]